MFTGIITGLGRIVAIQSLGSSSHHGRQLTIEAPAGYLDDVGLGDSIALNGACMTVTALDPSHHRFCIDISAESLDKTCGLAEPGIVNLEKALRAHDRLGGHIVSGHVDGMGSVTHFARVGESWELRILAPQALSLGCEVSINLIPHTVENTALSQLAQGSRVNLEIDLIARYVERMLQDSRLPSLTNP